MSAYLVVANFPNVGEQIWYGAICESAEMIKDQWRNYANRFNIHNMKNKDGVFYMPVPLYIIHVEVNGKTEILPWEDS